MAFDWPKTVAFGPGWTVAAPLWPDVSVLDFKTYASARAGLANLTFPIRHCASSVLCVDNTDMPKPGGNNFVLVVTCEFNRFRPVFPCHKLITRKETIKNLPEEQFSVYRPPKETNSDEDFKVRSDTGWYRGILRALTVRVSTGIPHIHRSNPLREPQIQGLK